ncbi:DUF5011 domain-containing protein [Listeria booriae]|uniref:immunoglobulin-like domain-containing protein n=1 Tax=Listeria booriae TaxID=1552123 RepID=UPI0016244A38|nr:immunoglobulin-like domain-containing protein [Listeria booriae]MBC2317280.1 DUF5011 domain-containing protein [Listeria booriae]
MNTINSNIEKLLKIFLIFSLVLSAFLIYPSNTQVAATDNAISNEINVKEHSEEGLRTFEGKLQFDVPEDKAPVGNDIVILRDVSWTFNNYIESESQVIKQIASELDLTNDRMMIINISPWTNSFLAVDLTNDLNKINEGLNSKEIGPIQVPEDSGFQFAKEAYEASKGNSSNNPIFITISDFDVVGGDIATIEAGAQKVKDAGYKLGMVYIDANSDRAEIAKNLVSSPEYFFNTTDMSEGITALREMAKRMYTVQEAKVEWRIPEQLDILSVSAKDDEGNEIPVELDGNIIRTKTPQDANKKITIEYVLKETDRITGDLDIGQGSISYSNEAHSLPDISITSNNVPIIEATDKTVKKGTSFNPMAGVTASDTEDGNMADKVTVTANDVDTSAVGTYHVTYSVTDSDGNTTTKTITVTVTSNDAPVITASDKTLKKGDSFDPMAGVSASDTEDGNVTDKVSVTANDVDTSAVGTYHVTYSVTDSDGNTTTKTITVTVTSNDAPVIVASDQTIKKGKAFDVMAGVSASDLEDGDVTRGITVTANDVDTNTVGTYHVTYSVTDSDGNTTTKTITITITSNDAPTFTTSDVYLKVGDTFNPYAGITASDTEDGDLTDRIDIDSSNVDMTQAGTYAVEYSVTDSDNNTTKITRHVYVRTNDKPVIHASDQTFKAGASFDPLAGMSASDTEDGDITANVTITANDVDANQAGTYHVTYSVTDSDDNTTTKTITITVLTNEKPVITAADITQKAHRSIDPMAGVTASDLEDGDLTANIKIIANDINIDVPGEYHVTYSVLDSDGNETEKTITVTILSNDAPVIHGQDVTFKAGKAFDPMAGVTASDTEDGDITSTIEMTANDVNPDVAGVYHVTYSVTDADGNTTEATYTVTVLTNEKPVIHATDQTLAYGQAFDPMAGVTAEDLEDGDLTGSIKIIANDVNPLQAGIYHVTYSVTDADGNETQITITVLVGAQPVDPIIPADPETPMHVTPAPVQVADPIISSVSDPVRELPKTGDTDNTAQVITIGGLLAMLGALFLRRKK